MHASPVVVEYARPDPLLCNDYLADRGFTWVTLDESDDAHRYAVYLWSRGYTTDLHPAVSPAAFSEGHPEVKEHDIAVAPPEHVLSMGANLLIVAAAEHNVTVGPPEQPHAESTHGAAPSAPAP